MIPETLHQLISKWRIDQRQLAKRMNMPLPTFLAKLSDAKPAYRFKEHEEKMLFEILHELVTDIEAVTGISFYKALKIVNKEKFSTHGKTLYSRTKNQSNNKIILNSGL